MQLRLRLLLLLLLGVLVVHRQLVHVVGQQTVVVAGVHGGHLVLRVQLVLELRLVAVVVLVVGQAVVVVAERQVGVEMAWACVQLVLVEILLRLLRVVRARLGHREVAGE